MSGTTAGATRPLAVLLSGPPGSGKTTVGTQLARRLGAALLDLDTATAGLTAVVAGLHGHGDLDAPALADLTRGPRYETLLELAADSLGVGTSVVLVAPFTAERRDPAAWERTRRRLEDAGAAATLVWLRISGEEVLRRVAQRAASRDQAKLARTWLAELDLDPPSVAHLEVDALDPPPAIAERLLAALSGRG